MYIHVHHLFSLCDKDYAPILVDLNHAPIIGINPFITLLVYIYCIILC